MLIIPSDALTAEQRAWLDTIPQGIECGGGPGFVHDLVNFAVRPVDQRGPALAVLGRAVEAIARVPQQAQVIHQLIGVLRASTNMKEAWLQTQRFVPIMEQWPFEDLRALLVRVAETCQDGVVPILVNTNSDTHGWTERGEAVRNGARLRLFDLTSPFPTDVPFRTG